MDLTVKELIKEHQFVSTKIKELDYIIYHSNSFKNVGEIKSDDDLSYTMSEFVNISIQLAGYRQVHKALSARLVNCGIEIKDGKYYKKLNQEDLNV